MSRRPVSRFGASISLGSLAGIPIRLHFTFLLLIAWMGWQAIRAGEGGGFWFLLLVLLFACVVLHELGHALMARLFGVRTREIILLPIGGLARLERMPVGVAELLIALAGPAVNLALSMAFAIGALAIGLPEPWTQTAMSGLSAMLWVLVFANISLMVFNLLPAFPMDGGRVLRGLLAFFVPMEQATLWATRVGQGMAILFVLVGISLPNPFLILIAVLVFFGASQELYFQRSSSHLAGRTASEAMTTRFEPLAPQDSLERAATLLRESDQQVFPVIDGWGRAAGLLTRGMVIRALREGRTDEAVLDVMERDPPTVGPAAPLEKVAERLRATGLPVVVVEDSRVLGVVTGDKIGEVVELGGAARG